MFVLYTSEILQRYWIIEYKITNENGTTELKRISKREITDEIIKNSSQEGYSTNHEGITIKGNNIYMVSDNGGFPSQKTAFIEVPLKQ